MEIRLANPDSILGPQDQVVAGPTRTFKFEARENFFIHTRVDVVVIRITYSEPRVFRRDRGFAGTASAPKFNVRTIGFQGIGAHLFTSKAT